MGRELWSEVGRGVRSKMGREVWSDEGNGAFMWMTNASPLGDKSFFFNPIHLFLKFLDSGHDIHLSSSHYIYLQLRRPL